MFKLVKNEIYKLFHKKSTYITLFVLLLFVILTTVIYKNMNIYANFTYDDPYYLANLEKEIKEFDLTTGSKEEYSSLLASYEIQKYVNGKNNNWQVQFYYANITNDIYKYYDLLYVYKSEEEAKILRANIDEDLARLENGEWRYFANKKLTTINESIKSIKENPNTVGELGIDLEVYEYQKYLLEYRLENDVSYENGYLNTALNELEDLIQDKINYENASNEEAKASYKDGYARFFENEYIIKNKVDTNNEQSLRALITNFFGEYLFLILVFVIMIAGAIISDEFSKGTIKSLLTLPYRRNQILLAKFITILLMIPFVTLFILLAEFIVGGIAFGFSSLSIPVIGYNFGLKAVEVMSVGKYFLLNFVAILPMIVLLATLAFALSALICNTAFSITITFCGYIASAIINEFALMYKIKFLNYFVTTNWDLRDFLFGGSSSFNIPISQSIIVCFVYFAIMIVVSMIVFKKRNIKNI